MIALRVGAAHTHRLSWIPVKQRAISQIIGGRAGLFAGWRTVLWLTSPCQTTGAPSVGGDGS